MSMPRHRAPRKQRPAYFAQLRSLSPFLSRKGRRAYLATLGATGAGAVTAAILLPAAAPAVPTVRLPLAPHKDAHTLPVTLAQMPVAHRAGPATYTLRPGDTLGGVAALLCGNAADFRALAANNHIRYANQISAGDVIRVACRAAAAALARVQLAPPAPPAAPVPVLAAARAPVQQNAQQQVQAPVQVQSQSSGALSGTLGCSGLERLWDAAGGNPGDAEMAAAIAMAESGGNQFAVSPTDDFGYWQINASNGSLATTNALGNAKSAIILSGNGANWSPWTTYTSGEYAGKC